MKLHDIDRQTLCKRLGFKYSTVTDWINAEKYPRIDKIEMMANYFGISKADLVERRTPTANTFPLPPSVEVPVIGSVRCGPGGLAIEYIDDETIAVTGDAENTRGFHVEGDSMEGDRIFDGDTAVVHLQPEVEDGQLAVVVIDGEEGTLKRVYLHRDTETGTLTQVILSASNPKYPPRIFAGEEMNQIRIVGRVVEVRRQM